MARHLGNPRRAAAMVALAAAILAVLALAIGWPGIATYDSVAQYRQALSGSYDDWHPPAMARLWASLHPLVTGTVPMFALAVVSYWLGLGLLATALALSGRTKSGVAVLAIGALPLFAAWQAVVLKDTQMAGATLAAFGLIAWGRLEERRSRVVAITAAGVLLGYATMVRANAVFATVPLAAMLLPVAPRYRFAVIVAGTLAVLALAPPINHRLFGAEPTAVVRTLPIYDLAGITHFADADVGLLPAERASIATRHCYKPFFWDPLGDDAHCGAITERLDEVPIAALDRLWLTAIARHPVAYAEHRIAHLNATLRWIIPFGWPSARPPHTSEANDLGLPSPGESARAVAIAGGWCAETPLGWPIAWIVVALAALGIALQRRSSPARDLALALMISALSLEASFAVVSIASDLRYHLWPMIATALAVVLLAGGGSRSRRPLIAGGIALALVVAIGGYARMTFPTPPQSYAGMLG